VIDDAVRTGPRTPAGAYLRSFWQPVYRGEDLAPGRAVPIAIMSEKFTLEFGAHVPRSV
jgi:5,5'-dehydrodivanillate O-demethylase